MTGHSVLGASRMALARAISLLKSTDALPHGFWLVWGPLLVAADSSAASWAWRWPGRAKGKAGDRSTGAARSLTDFQLGPAATSMTAPVVAIAFPIRRMVLFSLYLLTAS